MVLVDKNMLIIISEQKRNLTLYKIGITVIPTALNFFDFGVVINLRGDGISENDIIKPILFFQTL